ncbi:MAG: M1 family aminopeptidase [Bryobacteraceae bacterium]
MEYTVYPAMKLCRLLVCLAVLCSGALCQEPTAASLEASLRDLSIDPNEIYHVRDLRFARGDFTIYLNDGLLAFTKPVGGQVIGAVFTTAGTEAGDAEIIVTPPTRGERASLAYFTKTPNLDEHFSQAVFVFSDQMRAEALHQMEQNEAKKASVDAVAFSAQWNQTLEVVAGDVEVPLLGSMLNHDPPAKAVFYAVMGGKTLGAFEISYNPHQTESSAVGRSGEGAGASFQVWTSFTPRKSPSPLPQPFSTPAYRIEADISPSLKVSATTSFSTTSHDPNLRAIELELSGLMNVTSATINGAPVEVVQSQSSRDVDDFNVSRLLLVAPQPFPVATPLQVEIHHEGSVIRDAGEGIYFVEARNIWFPHLPLDSAKFDLTFRCPSQLRVISSGKLASETVDGGVRVIHRVLDSPAQFVGFNVGDFEGVARDQPPFHVEFYANRTIADRILRSGVPPSGANSGQVNIASASGHESLPAGMPVELEAMAGRAAEILGEFASEWGPAPTNNIAVTPIPGNFGQGFPGLIYLSIYSYLPVSLRPSYIRDSILNVFYSEILLPHEIAHQWWGNLVLADDYRSNWLVEALANYAALEFFEKERGGAALEELLKFYLKELSSTGKSGKPIESDGPLNIGLRLRASDANAWRVITYDKGTWVIRMLALRMGRQRFAEFLRALARDAAGKGLSNEAFRREAMRFLPEGDPDPGLEYFFDAWVYGTGIPRLSLQHVRANQYVLRQSGVDREFSVDVPMQVKAAGAADKVLWVRSSAEGTPFTAPGPPSSEVLLPLLSDFLYTPD